MRRRAGPRLTGDGARPPDARLWPRLFRAASRLRGERAIHATGIALTGAVTVPGGAGLGAPLLDVPGRYAAVLRFSRSLGLPAPLPDVLGLAVRLLDAGGPGRHQDLLLDTGHPAPRLRRLPLPARDLLGGTYSTLLPLDVGGRPLLLGARAARGSPRATDPAALRDLLPLHLELLVADGRGPWRSVAEVTATGVLPAPEGRQLRFDPWTTGGGLVPVGRLNQWRRGTYPASHVGPDA